LCTLHENLSLSLSLSIYICNVKVIPQQAEVAQGVPGRLRPRIFLTFGTTRVVGRQPYAPVAFTPGHMIPSDGATKKFPVAPPGIDPGTFRIVEQCLNHYATPGPYIYLFIYLSRSVPLKTKIVQKNYIENQTHILIQ